LYKEKKLRELEAVRGTTQFVAFQHCYYDHCNGTCM
jgi:hypothetical protein